MTLIGALPTRLLSSKPRCLSERNEVPSPQILVTIVEACMYPKCVHSHPLIRPTEPGEPGVVLVSSFSPFSKVPRLSLVPASTHDIDGNTCGWVNLGSNHHVNMTIGLLGDGVCLVTRNLRRQCLYYEDSSRKSYPRAIRTIDESNSASRSGDCIRCDSPPSP